MPTNNALNLKDPGVVTYDGNGTFVGSVVAEHSNLIAGPSNTVKGLLQTNGQVLIGSTGADPVPNTLTAGTGITIDNAAGSITINASGSAYSWFIITATTHQAVIDQAYVTDNAGLITFTLPAAPALGDGIIIKGHGAGGFRIVSNTSQYMIIGKQQTTPTTGYLQSTNQYDSIHLHCIFPPNEWSVSMMVGNFTYT